MQINDKWIVLLLVLKSHLFATRLMTRNNEAKYYCCFGLFSYLICGRTAWRPVMWWYFWVKHHRPKNIPQKSYHQKNLCVFCVFKNCISLCTPCNLVLRIKAQDTLHVFYWWVEQHHPNHFVLKILCAAEVGVMIKLDGSRSKSSH